MENQNSEKPDIVDLNDIAVLNSLQRDYQLIDLQLTNANLKIEIAKLQLKLKYNLSDTDTIDSKSGSIQRI